MNDVILTHFVFGLILSGLVLLVLSSEDLDLLFVLVGIVLLSVATVLWFAGMTFEMAYAPQVSLLMGIIVAKVLWNTLLSRN